MPTGFLFKQILYKLSEQRGSSSPQDGRIDIDCSCVDRLRFAYRGTVPALAIRPKIRRSSSRISAVEGAADTTH